MKAVIYSGKNRLDLVDIKIPDIQDDDILVKIKACAVCGTDLRIFKHGHFKIGKHEKRVLGHELAGEIIDRGSNVKKLKRGWGVTIAPNIGCGQCEMCILGFNNLCPDYEAFGISLDGGFQEYMRVPSYSINAGNIFKIPENINFTTATLIEPLSCCFHSYTELKTKHTDSVLIIGSGPIGALHLFINKLAGASPIVAADISDTRLEMMKYFGADITINTNKLDLSEEVKKITNGKGIDVIIIACSVPQYQNTALFLASRRGRINYFAGLSENTKNVTINTNMIHYKELKVLATTGSTHSDFYQAIKIVEKNGGLLNRLISKTFPIEETLEAFKFSDSGKGMKSVVVFE